MNKCIICNSYFDAEDHLEYIKERSLDILGPNKQFILEKICPDCIKSDFSGSDRDSYISRPAPSISKGVISQKFISFLFILLTITSIFVFFYSVFSKFLLLNIPFYPYIIAYALLIVLVQPTKFAPLFLIVVLANFGFSSFRVTFFSHFGSTFLMIVITIMFILSNISSLTIFYNFLVQHLVLSKRNNVERRKGAWRSFFLTFALYFGLISPFYLGAIKTGPFHGPVEPEAYKVDRVHEEALTAEIADRQTARQYLLDGKTQAALSNRTGLLKSLEFYKMALELIPKFSTSLAEMAYSYASIGRILKEANEANQAIEENFRKAREAITKAARLNPNNPTVYGVKAILEYYEDNIKEARKSLEKAKSLAEKAGYSDRVLLAMTILEKKKVKRVEYLLGIQERMEKYTDSQELRDLYRNSAELNNLMGLSYYQIGDKTKASTLFERAIRLNPNYSEAYLNLALVYSAKERPNLYKKAAEKDPDFKHVANHYSILLNIQKWLKRFYWVLLAFFIINFIISSSRRVDPGTHTIRQQQLKHIKRMILIYFLIFICTFGVFELYIHISHPINTPSHMFPVSFPFF